MLLTDDRQGRESSYKYISKCPSCGGKIQNREGICQYCGTVIPENIRYSQEHTQKTKDEVKKEEQEKRRDYTLQKQKQRQSYKLQREKNKIEQSRIDKEAQIQKERFKAEKEKQRSRIIFRIWLIFMALCIISLIILRLFSDEV